MNFFQKIRDLIFPKLCVICGIEVCEDGYVCEKCAKKLAQRQGKLCPVCSSAVHKCKCNMPKTLSHIRCAFWYEGEIAGYILKMKKNRFEEMYEYSAQKLSALVLDDERLRSCDSICYVPRSRKKRRLYGTDAAFEVAKRVSAECGIPLYPYLVCVGKKHDQKALSSKERKRNISGAFVANESIPAPFGKVLLIDDVMTTGATAEECGKILKKSGASEVCGLFVARTKCRP